MKKILNGIIKIIAVLLIVFGLFYLMTFCNIQKYDYSNSCNELTINSDCLTLQHNMFACENANDYFNKNNCELKNITILPPKIEKFK